MLIVAYTSVAFLVGQNLFLCFDCSQVRRILPAGSVFGVIGIEMTLTLKANLKNAWSRHYGGGRTFGRQAEMLPTPLRACSFCGSGGMIQGEFSAAMPTICAQIDNSAMTFGGRLSG